MKGHDRHVDVFGAANYIEELTNIIRTKVVLNEASLIFIYKVRYHFLQSESCDLGEYLIL